MTSATTAFTPSSKRNPCPICGRTRDGDCRIGDGFALCHRGGSHGPPDGERKGDTLPRADGQLWAYVGETRDGRCGEYKLHTPDQGPTRNGHSSPAEAFLTAAAIDAAAAPAEPAPGGVQGGLVDSGDEVSPRPALPPRPAVNSSKEADQQECRQSGSQPRPKDEQEAGNRWAPRAEAEGGPIPRSKLLAGALEALERGDEDAYAEAQAVLMGRLRMTASQIQAALFRLLTQRQTAGQCKPGPGVVNIAAVRQLDHLVPGFVAEREQTMVHAPRGVGKTLAALAIGQSVATCRPLLDRGEAPRQGRVLYLATDSGCESMAAQMQELGLLDLPEFQNGHPEQRFFIRGHNASEGVTAWEATIPEILWLLRYVQDNQIDLVVIDSAKACLSLTDADYTDNKAVGALLTLFQRVVCPHVSVLWLHHDGRENGHNAGAKAWAEIPVMVHRIERVEEPRNRSALDAHAVPKGARRWVCLKSRIPGDEREFTYTLTGDGELQVTAEVEVVGSCQEAVVDVLTQALHQGSTSLATNELLEEVMRKHGRSSKTVRNTLSQLQRRRVLVRPGRGRWSLAPARVERASRARALGGCGVIGKEEGETPVIDRDLPMSRQCPDGTNRDIQQCPDPTPSGQTSGHWKPHAGQGISARLSRNPGESAHPLGDFSLPVGDQEEADSREPEAEPGSGSAGPEPGAAASGSTVPTGLSPLSPVSLLREQDPSPLPEPSPPPGTAAPHHAGACQAESGASPASPGVEPDPSWSSRAQAPSWLPLLEQLMVERPGAAATTLAASLRAAGGPQLSVPEARVWMDAIRARRPSPGPAPEPGSIGQAPAQEPEPDQSITGTIDTDDSPAPVTTANPMPSAACAARLKELAADFELSAADIAQRLQREGHQVSEADVVAFLAAPLPVEPAALLSSGGSAAA